MRLLQLTTYRTDFLALDKLLTSQAAVSPSLWKVG